MVTQQVLPSKSRKPRHRLSVQTGAMAGHLSISAGVVESEYTAVFKTAVLLGNCGFKPHRPHH